jgi:CBS domain-containing protein
MKVAESMSSDVRIADPEQSIMEAARIMAEADCGALPVGADGRLVGMITDRDIAIRAVAAGKGPDCLVREVMSSGICYCYHDQDIGEVTANMGDIKVRRLPVVDREKRLVGIISLGDIARADGHESGTARALHGISEEGGAHSQAPA